MSVYDVSLFHITDVVGPHSKLALYQLVFQAPGITYACKTLSTVKEEDEIVHFIVRAKPIEFISSLLVSIQIIFAECEKNKKKGSFL
jgi:hypothetical protein